MTLEWLKEELEKLAVMLEDADGHLETDEVAAMINDLLNNTPAATIIDRMGYDSGV